MKVNKERLVKTFLELVRIDSESGNESEIITFLEKKLKGLGLQTTIDKTGNLTGRLGDKPLILLSAHVDTVQPGNSVQPIVESSGLIKTDGSTVLGGDDKSGVASILELLETLRENDSPVNLEVVYTVSEEIGNVGARGLDFSKIESERALNLDSEPGDIVIGEPSNLYFDIEITGIAAHAGDHPERGISAIQIASEAISKLEWGRLDEETTANVGKITGGLARNIVAEKVNIEAEARSRDDSKLKVLADKITKEFEDTTKKYGGEISIQVVQRGWSYRIDPEDSLVQTIAKACDANGVMPDIMFIGGNTDAGVFSAHDIKTITTGSCGKNIHTTAETITTSGLVLGTQIALDTVLLLAQE